MFQVVARHWEHIFFLLTSPKCDLGEGKKGTILVVAKHCELIFCLLTRPKCDLVEVGKAMFKSFAWNF